MRHTILIILFYKIGWTVSVLLPKFHMFSQIFSESLLYPAATHPCLFPAFLMPCPQARILPLSPIFYRSIRNVRRKAHHKNTAIGFPIAALQFAGPCQPIHSFVYFSKYPKCPLNLWDRPYKAFRPLAHRPPFSCAAVCTNSITSFHGSAVIRFLIATHGFRSASTTLQSSQPMQHPLCHRGYG